jgi:hypothetical protein
MRNGSRPTVSRLITTAGRILRISAPTEGPNCTIQILPLWGGGAFARQVLLAKGLEIG